jgi:hypothetical protein
MRLLLQSPGDQRSGRQLYARLRIKCLAEDRIVQLFCFFDLGCAGYRSL